MSVCITMYSSGEGERIMPDILHECAQHRCDIAYMLLKKLTSESNAFRVVVFGGYVHVEYRRS